MGDCDLACFLMAFGVLTPKEAKRLWPQIQYHESNRIKEMTRTSRDLGRGDIVYSDDHRVVQADAMWLQSLNLKRPVDAIKQRFHNPNCVNKTWPRFWDFLIDIPNILQLS